MSGANLLRDVSVPFGPSDWHRLSAYRNGIRLLAFAARPASPQLIGQALCSPRRKSKTQQKQGLHDNVSTLRAVTAVTRTAVGTIIGGALAVLADAAAAQTV